MEHYELQLDGMSCIGCEATIKSEVESLGTITDVEIDHRTGVISFRSVDASAVGDAGRTIEDLGYGVVN